MAYLEEDLRVVYDEALEKCALSWKDPAAEERDPLLLEIRANIWFRLASFQGLWLSWDRSSFGRQVLQLVFYSALINPPGLWLAGPGLRIFSVSPPPGEGI